MENRHGCKEIKITEHEVGLVARSMRHGDGHENDTIVAMSDARFRNVSRMSETNEKIDLMMIQE
jgi:hypothetical protein